ncbi:hypothetical protein KPL28_01825 [Clostridium algidicarnis]|uniref:hypothetical protein n=1 Tax=Clostridium algidicarnis TaxID=37659 RepID=UPI001C0B16D0|nr:hypothetical protein [Clostridium algidicarnis]MBU3208369.1 hypothetical protein [Clostridium algidicarnis]
MIKFKKALMKKRWIVLLLVMIVTTLTTINKATVQAKENSKNINSKNSSETILHIYNINGFNIMGDDGSEIKKVFDNKIKPQLDDLGISYIRIKQAKKVHNKFLNTDKYIMELDNVTV